MKGNLLNVGQNLKIPGLNENVSKEEYVVKKGDTLYSIAKKYNTSVDNLKSINNITTDSLAIGQIIKLPKNNKVYTVKKGDTLYGIARDNGTTVSAISSLNNLATSVLTIGQKLLLP